MRSNKLRIMIFLALCCDLGLFAKRIIGPIGNILTDALHIPGGIGTAFSLMFLVVASSLVPRFGCCTIMSAVQSVLALGFGMVGSMGALSPIGYIVPGLFMDVLNLILRKTRIGLADRMLLVNALASVSASFVANIIVFHLWGVVLLLYLSVSALSGALCGLLGAQVVRRVAPVLGKSFQK